MPRWVEGSGDFDSIGGERLALRCSRIPCDS
jgi:hypothetical protein